MATVESIAGDLRRLGISNGDVVMVHASLRAVGPVDGGAEGMVDALDRAVGTDGSVLMMLSARDDFAWVNDRPEEERAELLADAPAFDSRATPGDPEVGVLGEIFRQQPGTIVNHHPEGRFGARGRLARRLVEDPPWDDYYGPGSPLERLVEAGGKVLRLGADPDTVTLLHYAEYLADVPHKRRVLRHRKVLDDGAPAIRTVSALDDSEGIVDYPGEDYFIQILQTFLATGRVRTGRVGNAPSELFTARDMVACGVEWMNRHLS